MRDCHDPEESPAPRLLISIWRTAVLLSRQDFLEMRVIRLRVNLPDIEMKTHITPVLRVPWDAESRTKRHISTFSAVRTTDERGVAPNEGRRCAQLWEALRLVRANSSVSTEIGKRTVPRVAGCARLG
jgi:hypothetical protein